MCSDARALLRFIESDKFIKFRTISFYGRTVSQLATVLACSDQYRYIHIFFVDCRMPWHTVGSLPAFVSTAVLYAAWTIVRSYVWMWFDTLDALSASISCHQIRLFMPWPTIKSSKCGLLCANTLSRVWESRFNVFWINEYLWMCCWCVCRSNTRFFKWNLTSP